MSRRPGREDSLRHLEVRSARSAVHGEWPTWADADLVAALRQRGIDRPYAHQVGAAEAAYAGQHAVLATGTASGKSLGYLLPALTRIADARGERGQRGSTTLYLSPTKALAQDQLTSVSSLGVPGLRIATHDGDSSR
ncbi:MAG: DEAD/DEAH box helicase, partial [Myxococcales bacterium]